MQLGSSKDSTGLVKTASRDNARNVRVEDEKVMNQIGKVMRQAFKGNDPEVQREKFDLAMRMYREKGEVCMRII